MSLKKKNPFITNNHCIAHRLALIGKDVANEIPYFKSYESTLKKLYNYFSRSYKRMKNLRMLQEQDDDDPGLTILNLVTTRWLSLSNTDTNLHNGLYTIMDALQSDINNNECDDIQIPQEIYNEISDSDFIIATKFLADILYIFKFLMLVFQKDYITLSDIHYILELTINAINVDFVGIDNVPPTYGNHLLNICKKII